MKKSLIVAVLAILLLVTYSIPIYLPKSDKDISISYYTQGKHTSESIYLYDDVYMTTFKYDEHERLVDNLVNIIGVSATYSGDYDDFKKAINQCKVAVQKEETVGNVHIIYGISESCGKPVQADGINVNFQIAIRDNVITVGTPLIMGSY